MKSEIVYTSQKGIARGRFDLWDGITILAHMAPTKITITAFLIVGFSGFEVEVSPDGFQVLIPQCL